MLQLHLNDEQFLPAALKGSGVLSSPERASGRADKPRKHCHVHNFSRIIFKLGKDSYYPKISVMEVVPH